MTWITPPAISTLGVTTMASLTKMPPAEVIVMVTLPPLRVMTLEPFMSDALYNGTSLTTT